MNVIIFDIETIPDVAAGRRLLGLEDLSDAAVAEVMFQQRRQVTGGSDFLRQHLHKIVAISLVFRHQNWVKVWSLGEPESSEKDLVQRFFDGLAQHQPTLVSWNGSGFDLPVLHYRALFHGVQAATYWETGNREQGFRWNNYISRFHWRHTDLMDVLAGYQARASAPLDEIATLLGFPGKMGMSGAKVWDAFQAGEIQEIRNYCETDVLNTYLVYLCFQRMRGQLIEEDFQKECQLLKDTLKHAKQAHLDGFLSAWESAGAVYG